MKITFINIGFGESVLIEHESYKILVDAGIDHKTDYLSGSHKTPAQYLREQHIEHLDLVIMTHIHDDHSTGLVEVLQSCSVGRIWVNCLSQLQNLPFTAKDLGLAPMGGIGSFLTALEAYQTFLKLAAERSIPVEEINLNCEQRITLPGGLMIGRLPCSQEDLAVFKQELDEMADTSDSAVFMQIADRADRHSNQLSLGLHLQSPSLSIFLTADKSSGWQSTIETYKWYVQADILKAAHHGIADSTDENLLLSRVHPSVFVVCTSADRRYQTPSQSAIQRAEAYFDAYHLPRRIVFSDSVEWPPYSEPTDQFNALEIWREGLYGPIQIRNTTS